MITVVKTGVKSVVKSMNKRRTLGGGQACVTAQGRVIAQINCGQSILEFLILLPVLVALTVILIRINTAIQISIVDQQYARAQALFLAYNSPFYPELSKQSSLISGLDNQMVVGVSDNSGGGDDSAGGSYRPVATVQLVTRGPKITGPDTPQDEPDKQRAKVRIRNTVTLCTQNLYVPGARGAGVAISSGTLDGSTNFMNFCSSSLQYSP